MNLNIEAIIIIVAILITVIFDAVRDAWIWRKESVGWWQWHRVKWVSFYCPLATLGYFYLKCCHWNALAIFFLVVLALICWIVWKEVYKHFSTNGKRTDREKGNGKNLR